MCAQRKKVVGKEHESKGVAGLIKFLGFLQRTSNLIGGYVPPIEFLMVGWFW
jgi:hypothetical protein